MFGSFICRIVIREGQNPNKEKINTNIKIPNE
jgi:hypothetical protein